MIEQQRSVESVILINGRDFHRPAQKRWLNTAHVQKFLGQSICGQHLDVYRVLPVEDVERLGLNQCKSCQKRL